MSYDFSVTLYRDSLFTPWGFRLEGGRDYQTPLTIQRVFTGSPASSELQRGDIILAIQNRDATFLLHKEADDLIRSSGGSILLTIRRSTEFAAGQHGQTYRPVSALHSSPPQYRSAITNYNSNYAHLFSNEDPTAYVRSRPIEKMKDPKPILSQTGSPIMPGQTPSFSSSHTIKRYRPQSTLPKSIHRLSSTQAGYSPQPPQHHTTNIYSHQPMNTNYTAVPYNHDKRMVSQIQQSLVRAAANTTYHHNQHHAQPSPHYSSTSSSYHPVYPPQPSANHHHLNNTITYYDDFNLNYNQPSYGAGGNVATGFNDFNSGATPSSNLPKVKNLQYNSPIGLYSKDNIREELNRQVGSGHQLTPGQPSSQF